MIGHHHFASQFNVAVGDYTGVPGHAFSSAGAGSRAVMVVVEPSGDAPWCATFAAPDPGRRALSALLGTPRLSGLCVVERGTAFLSDVYSPEGFEVVPVVGPIVAAEELVEHGVLLLLSPWAITAIGADGPLWVTSRIAIDGCRVDEISDGWIRGVADPDDIEPRDFAVDLATGEVIGGVGSAPLSDGGRTDHCGQGQLDLLGRRSLRHAPDVPRTDQRAESLTLMNVEAVLRPLLLVGDRQTVGSAVSGWIESGLTVRVVRGRKMRTLGGLFDEFAAALQFPLYFGENWDAFDECISDLETLSAGEGYVVTIIEPDQVLVDAGVEALRLLANSLESAASEWSQSVELGEWWDRPAIPFHLVLAGEREPIELAARRWSAVGSDPQPFRPDDHGSVAPSSQRAP